MSPRIPAVKKPAKPRYSRCAVCEEDGGGPKRGRPVITLTADGWEHMANGRPAGQWLTRPGPPASYADEGARIGHMARPITTAIGEVIWTNAAGTSLTKQERRS